MRLLQLLNGYIKAVLDVGIGTLVPLAKLHIVTVNITDIGQIIQGVLGQVGDLTQWRNSTGTVITVVDADGKVGIGTDTPLAELHVVGDIWNAGTTTITEVLKGETNLTIKSNENSDGLIILGDETLGFILNEDGQSATLGGGEIKHMINGANENSLFEFHQDGSAGAGGTTYHRHTNTADLSSDLVFLRSRGDHGSSLVVQENNQLGQLRATGYDGTDYAESSAIRFEVDGAPGDDDMPGRITFLTSPQGSQVPLERMRIDSAGNVGIGTDSLLGMLDVVQDSVTGILIRGALYLDSTSGPSLSLAKSRGTVASPLPALAGDRVFNLTGQGWTGSAFDTISSLRASVQNASGPLLSGMYEFRLNDTSGNLQTRMCIFDDGTVGIGTSSPSTKLEVSGIITGEAVVGELWEEGTGTVTADSILLTAGVNVSGTVADTITFNQVYYQIQEVAATPGFDAEFNFTMGAYPGKLIIIARYEGNPAHNVVVEAWNYTTLGWDSFSGVASDIPNGTVDLLYAFDYADLLSVNSSVITDYVSGTDSKIRFYHSSNGTASHDIYIDFVSIQEKQFIVVTPGTYVTITGLEEGENGNVTADGVNGTLTIITDGLYDVAVNMSFSGDDGEYIEVHLFHNGVRVPKAGFSRRLGDSGDIGSTSFGCKLPVVAGDVLDVRFTSQLAGVYINIENMNFSITRLN